MTNKTPIVAIIGPANVGKSSLFNAIIRKREAIIFDEPGTTVDSLWAKATMNDGEEYRNIWLIDTAGLKKPSDEFEVTIQDQAIEAVAAADLILLTIDGSIPITDYDRMAAKIVHKSGKPCILLVNKSDMIPVKDPSRYRGLGFDTIVFTAATQKAGFDHLASLIVQSLPKVGTIDTEKDITLALIGRPNAGKSSLFNTLLQKQQAVVSSKPGTTRDVNRYDIRYKDHTIGLIDTAGIRRHSRIDGHIERFSIMRALSAIEDAEICLLVIDATDVAVKQDQHLAGLVKDAGKGLILIITKWDLVEDKDNAQGSLLAKFRREFDFAPFAPIIFTSSLTGQNAVKIFELALEIHEVRHRTIPTTKLNRWLGETTHKISPKSPKPVFPKLRYITQTDINPPTFKMFGAHTDLIHWSYKRHLEKSMREAFDFTGTPIRFWFTNRVDRHKDNDTK